MRRLSFILILAFCFSGCCSIPSREPYNQLFGYTKEEKKKSFGTKITTLKDFRGNIIQEKNIAALNKKVEEYISNNADSPSPNESMLRQHKVAEGATREEVRLILGQPDKINPGPPEVWIYRLKKISAFTILIFPVFFPHEGYYLYFKEGALTGIERHYFEQVIHCGDPPDGMGSKKIL